MKRLIPKKMLAISEVFTSGVNSFVVFFLIFKKRLNAYFTTFISPDSQSKSKDKEKRKGYGKYLTFSIQKRASQNKEAT
jgi:hypothetical protein